MTSHDTELAELVANPAGLDALVRTALDTGASQSEPTGISDGTRDLVLLHTVPDGYTVHTTDVLTLRERLARFEEKTQGYPNRRTGHYTVTEIGSLLAFFDKHAGPSPEIWVSPQRIRAVLDAAGDTLAGSYEDHTVTLPLAYAPEWLAWTGLSGKFVDQETFAEFLEANAASVIAPPAAVLLEVAQSLQATSSVEFKSAHRTSDGQRAFRYEETTQAKAGQKGELEIPEAFTLALRVFAGDDTLVEVGVRFRYRIRQDKLHLGVVIDRPDRIVDAALDNLVGRIALHVKDRGLVLLGTGR